MLEVRLAPILQMSLRFSHISVRIPNAEDALKRTLETESFGISSN